MTRKPDDDINPAIQRHLGAAQAHDERAQELLDLLTGDAPVSSRDDDEDEDEPITGVQHVQEIVADVLREHDRRSSPHVVVVQAQPAQVAPPEPRRPHAEPGSDPPSGGSLSVRGYGLHVRAGGRVALAVAGVLGLVALIVALAWVASRSPPPPILGPLPAQH